MTENLEENEISKPPAIVVVQGSKDVITYIITFNYYIYIYKYIILYYRAENQH